SAVRRVDAVPPIRRRRRDVLRARHGDRRPSGRTPHRTVRGMVQVHRLGDKLINFYLVDTGSGLVLIDAGLPAHWQSLLDVVHGLGRKITDIASVLITHGHLDHIGLAERVRQESGARVWVHEADAPILATPRRTGKYWKPEKSLVGYAVRR